MNKKNKKQEFEKKRLEQKKLLIQMKKEIDTLESQIEHSHLKNVKIKTIRNLKITTRALQLVAPYLVTAGIVAGGFTLGGDIPFYPNDEFKIYSNVMVEFDNVGNIREEQKYGKFKDGKGNSLNSSDNVLYYYSKWEKGTGGLYSRTVKIYSVEKKSYEDIMELFKKEDLRLEDVLGEPSSNIKETKNNLTEDEIQEESIIKAVIYREDEDDYIMRKETVGENIGLSVLYLLVTFLAEFVPLFFRSECSSFDFSGCVDEIKRKHQPLDIDTITKKLELKRDNYNRMMR